MMQMCMYVYMYACKNMDMDIVVIWKPVICDGIFWRLYVMHDHGQQGEAMLYCFQATGG